MNQKRWLCLAAAALALPTVLRAQTPLGTAFTYQGQPSVFSPEPNELPGVTLAIAETPAHPAVYTKGTGDLRSAGRPGAQASKRSLSENTVCSDPPAPIVIGVRPTAHRQEPLADNRDEISPRSDVGSVSGPVPVGDVAPSRPQDEAFDKAVTSVDTRVGGEVEAADPFVETELAHLKAATVPETYAEVEIPLDGWLGLEDVLALPQAPGGVFEELYDPHRAVVQVPYHVAGRLIKEGVELSVLRRFVLVEGGAIDPDAEDGTGSTAGMCTGGEQFGQNGANVPIPDNDGWVYSGITLSGAPSGMTVTCLDVHYEIIHTYIGDLNVDLNDQNIIYNYDLWGPGQGGGTQNLNQTVTGIHTFDDLSVNQTWKLYAQDGAAIDTGYIDTWWIKIYYDAPTTIWDAWWTDQIDADGDGYRSSARLNWDPDIVGCSGSVEVYEKVYWMRANSGVWNLSFTNLPHALTDCITGDSASLNYEGGQHDVYDWKIEIYRTGEHFTPDYTRGPANDTDLNDYKMELPSEELVPTVWGAWWTGEVDQDGDGCVRSAQINWDTDVVGCSGSLSVVDKLYYRPAAGGAWSQIAEAGPRTINNCSSADSMWVEIWYTSACGPSDYKIEVYYAGGGSPAATAGPSDDPDLNDHLEESPQNDCNAAICSDGIFCNGVEYCDALGNCQPGGNPCPGQLCRERDDRCVDCLSQSDCLDAFFCNGVETCDEAGYCHSGSDPCPRQLCRESDDQCVDCLSSNDCTDGLFCNGQETCNAAGVCLDGTYPCPAQLCRESDDQCVDCLTNGDCNDSLYCNGVETCSAAGACIPGTDPCPGQMCHESDNTCVECLSAPDCSDGLYCTGAETCDAAGDCQPGADPCPGNFCVEPSDIPGGCVACLEDAHCEDFNECTDNVCVSPGYCTFQPKPQGTACGDPADTDCTDPDSCDGAGTCLTRHAPPGASCPDDGNLCTADECQSGNCTHPNLPDSASCDDGLFCNGLDTCNGSGDCRQGAPPCPRGEVCNEELATCDPDCNVNDVSDNLDIAGAHSRDRNENGVPDECEDLPPFIMDGVLLLEASSLVPPTIRFERGLPRFITMKVALPDNMNDDPLLGALDYLDRFKDLYSLRDPKWQLFLRRIVSRGGNTLFFGQQKNGIPVHAAELTVALEQDHIVATAAKYLPEIPVFPPPALLAMDAEQIVLQDVPANEAVVPVAPKLMYYNAALTGGEPDETHLAWRVIVRGLRADNNGGGKWTYFVDSEDGAILKALDEIQTGKDLDLSSAHQDSSIYCWDWPHSDGTTQWFTESGPTGSYPGGSSAFPGGDADGDSSWYYANAMYNYLLSSFGRRSYDNDDEQIETFVHVGHATCPNAFANTTCLKFCDGYVTLDVFAHEFTHSMGDETCDLEYENQSGAIDESYCDFFGAMMDNNWWHAEGSSGGHTYSFCSYEPGRACTTNAECLSVGAGLCVNLDGMNRNMANPPACGDPDHWNDRYPGSGDNGGVHTNSGILNKVAYLISAGDTHNGVAVVGIGSWKAERLYYKVYTQRLSSNSDFMAVRDWTVQQAKTWAGSSYSGYYGFTQQNVCDVINAFASVGLGNGDIDCDGIPDQLDTDDDGDHIPDSTDNCPTAANPSQTNSDGAGDGGDACDPDDDNDSILDDGDNSGTEGDNTCTNGFVANCDDNCPRISNPAQTDDDNDGIGDVCDDDDYDKVLNLVDNCRYVWNKNQENTDNDSLGDACDDDDDNDGIDDDDDSCPYNVNLGTDVDTDGWDDVCDKCPNTVSSQSDNDGDGLGDECDSDDDNDGFPDSVDTCPRIPDPDQTGLACAPHLPCLDVLQEFNLTFPFPFGDAAPYVRIPIDPRGPADGPDWLPSNFRVQIGVDLPADLPVYVVNDRDRAVARSDAGLSKLLSFRPAASSHYRFPQAGGPSAAPSGTDAPDRKGNDQKEKNNDPAFKAESYWLVIYTSPEVQGGVPYSITLRLQSTQPAVGDFDYDGDVDLMDYDVFWQAFGGPGQQTTDERTDFDGDNDTDLRDFAAFQEALTDP